MTALGIFVKEPIAGQVKTRLAASIGPQNAAELAAAFQADILEHTATLADRRIIAYSSHPGGSHNASEWIDAGDAITWPQPQTGLGERLIAYFEQNLRPGERHVVIGSDSPTLPAAHIRDAFTLQKNHDCVIGPAMDGGYTLIGVKQHHPELFQGISWSTARVLLQTIERAKELGLRLALLPPWYDVDTLDDLLMLQGHLQAMTLAGAAEQLPRRTLEVIQSLASSDTA